MDYKECKVLFNLKKKDTPLISKVEIDEFTEMVNKCFDYDFNGESKFYPYELPQQILDMDFDILCIVGASGKGKSTLCKEFLNNNLYHYASKQFDNNKAIVSNFNNPDNAAHKLSAVGLNSLPVWCRPRNVLSVGEGFRADIALNVSSYTIFDEFTSTIDRNVAMSTSNGLQKYIRTMGKMNHIIFCSCHKDYIPFLKPNIVIDLDEEKIYDCGDGTCLGKTYLSKCTNPQTRTFGEYLGSIII